MNDNNNEKHANGFINQCIYDPDLLYDLDCEDFYKKCGIDANLSSKAIGSKLKLRPLMLSDYDKGFMKLLSELTTVGNVSEQQFEKRFFSMKRCKNTYYVTVIENLETGDIVAAATLVVEEKFIHQASIRGRIEDVVVSADFRGRKLGHILLATLTALGKKLGCYKMSLECKDELLAWYENFGYRKDLGNNYMVQRF
uniref:Glucosamine 6-phosphate N-acetyltransferase n=1 Tax=Romanomermis culicivorax TaxID=13658 RepID=A0A915I961_ROMCU